MELNLTYNERVALEYFENHLIMILSDDAKQALDEEINAGDEVDIEDELSSLVVISAITKICKGLDNFITDYEKITLTEYGEDLLGYINWGVDYYTRIEIKGGNPAILSIGAKDAIRKICKIEQKEEIVG